MGSGQIHYTKEMRCFLFVNEHIDGELFPLIPRFYDNFRSAKVELRKVVAEFYFSMTLFFKLKNDKIVKLWKYEL